MFVFIISLTLFCLSLNNGDPLLDESDVYHTLYGNIASMKDLFLKEPNDAAPDVAPEDNDVDVNDKLDELDLSNAFDFHRANLTDEAFDLHDFSVINEKYSNFTKAYRNTNKNKKNNNTRRKYPDKWWIDPNDREEGDYREDFKKMQLKMVLIQFALHCRYEVGKALYHRDLVRGDKRYKLGYLFNRMRRLRTEQMKMVGGAYKQQGVYYRHYYGMMRFYERVVHFDVDMRDTTKMIKRVFSKDEPYDIFIVEKVKKNDTLNATTESSNGK